MDNEKVELLNSQQAEFEHLEQGFKELNSLQLAFVGGGIGDTAI